MHLPRSAHQYLILMLLPIFGVIGCSGPNDVPLYPVRGTITFDGKAVTPAQVAFVPDADKGNKTIPAAMGMVDATGQFTLQTEGKSGAAKGWFKVVVNTQVMPSEMPKDGKMPKAFPIPPKYGSPSSTPLSIEVLENAPSGHYDLKVSK